MPIFWQVFFVVVADLHVIFSSEIILAPSHTFALLCAHVDAPFLIIALLCALVCAPLCLLFYVGSSVLPSSYLRFYLGLSVLTFLCVLSSMLLSLYLPLYLLPHLGFCAPVFMKKLDSDTILRSLIGIAATKKISHSKTVSYKAYANIYVNFLNPDFPIRSPSTNQEFLIALYWGCWLFVWSVGRHAGGCLPLLC